MSEVTFDARVFAIGVSVSLLTTLVFGSLPVLRAGRMDIQRGLQQFGRPGIAVGYNFAKRALVIAEVALSLILLFGAALLLQTLWHLRNDRLGFQPEHVLTMTIPLKGTNLENRNRRELVAGLLAFAKRIPGTEEAAQAECTPLSGGSSWITFSRSDRPLPEAFHRGDGIFVCSASPGYSRASGTRILRGRFFTETDLHHPNTLAVINQAAVKAYFPREDPIGKQIVGGPQQEWKTVIGVAANTKNRGLNAEPEPQVFVNGLPDPGATELDLIVRSLGDRRTIEAAMAREARRYDRGLTVNFKSLDETIGDMTAGPRFNGMLLTSFAAIAVLMAVIGVYGLLTFTVTQRTHEIGIRIALGAERIQILELVLLEGAVLVFAGLAFGFAGVFALTRYLKAILYGVSATDPATLLIVGVGLMAAALVAIALPARKAASVDPLVALRHD